jgi:hypothetical protein
MIVQVLLFARARDLAESDMLTIDLPEGAMVGASWKGALR